MNIKYEAWIGQRCQGKSMRGKVSCTGKYYVSPGSQYTSGNNFGISDMLFILRHLLAYYPEVTDHFSKSTGLKFQMIDSNGSIFIHDINSRHVVELRHVDISTDTITCQSSAQYSATVVFCSIMHAINTCEYNERDICVVIDEYGADFDIDLVDRLTEVVLQCIDMYIEKGNVGGSVKLIFITHNGKLFGRLLHTFMDPKRVDNTKVVVFRNGAESEVSLSEIQSMFNTIDPDFKLFHEAITSCDKLVVVEGRDDVILFGKVVSIITTDKPYDKKVRFMDLNGWHNLKKAYPILKRIFGSDVSYFIDGDILAATTSEYKRKLRAELIVMGLVREEQLNYNASQLASETGPLRFLVLSDGEKKKSWNIEGLISKCYKKVEKCRWYNDIYPIAKNIADILLNQAENSPYVRILREIMISDDKISHYRVDSIEVDCDYRDNVPEPIQCSEYFLGTKLKVTDYIEKFMFDCLEKRLKNNSEGIISYYICGVSLQQARKLIEVLKSKSKPFCKHGNKIKIVIITDNPRVIELIQKTKMNL